jgi:DNA-binding SARP family transcriptional activator
VNREPVDVTITLLGGFRVVVGDRVIPDREWRLKRAAELIKMLALASRHRLPREQVLEALWPDADPDRSATNLRKIAFEARRILGLRDGIVLEEGLVKLAPAHPVTTDVSRFAEASQRALAADSPEACREVASWYGGDLLPDDAHAAWCEQDRRYLRAVFLDLLERGRLWGRLVKEEPTHERAHREIMRVQLDGGDRAGAMRQFDLLRTTLREEFGAAPEPETVDLYERALNMDGRDVPTPAERARALLAWGLVHWRRSDLDEAERTAVEARALAIDARLPRELAEASELLGLIAYAQGEWREVFARGFLDSLTRNADLSPFIFDANMCMSEFALGERTGLADLADLAQQMIRVADDIGSAQAEALGRLLRGETALLAGEATPEVREDLSNAARLHQEASSVTGWALSVERLAQLECRSGSRTRARARHRDALRIAQESSVPEHLLPLIFGGMLHDEQGEGAREIVDEAEDAIGSLRVCDPCAMSFRVGASMVCARSGDLDRARAYLAEARRVAQMWSGGPWHAAVDEADAIVSGALGAAPSEVTALLRRAGDRFRSAHREGDAARCDHAAAIVR